MKLNIDFSTREEKPQRQYEIVLGFMEGDGDGYEDVRFMFSEDSLKNKSFMDELEEFLVCMNTCIAKDGGGRGGFDSNYDLIDEYCHIPNWYKFYPNKFDNIEDEELIEDYEMSEEDVEKLRNGSSYFSHDFPSDGQGWYHSYCNLEIYYYDETGDRFPVSVDFKEATA